MRKPCCEKEGGVINKGAWSRQEDQKLIDYIASHGEGCWRAIPKAAGLLRCGKSCRLRWINYLRPDIKRGNFDHDEQDLIIKLHALLGNRWSLIAGRLPGRTDNEVKNYWNSHLKKKLVRLGIDPNNHKPQQHLPLICASPITTTLDSSSMDDASNIPQKCNNDNQNIGKISSQGNKIVGVGVGVGPGGVSNMVLSCVDDEETSSTPLDLNLDLTISITPTSPKIQVLDAGDSSNQIRVDSIKTEAEVETSPTLSLFR